MAENKNPTNWYLMRCSVCSKTAWSTDPNYKCKDRCDGDMVCVGWGVKKDGEYFEVNDDD